MYEANDVKEITVYLFQVALPYELAMMSIYTGFRPGFFVVWCLQIENNRL